MVKQTQDYLRIRVGQCDSHVKDAFLVGPTYSWRNQVENVNIPLAVEAIYFRWYIINPHHLELQSDNRIP